MKNILNFLDKWAVKIIFLLTVIIFFKTCNTNSNIQKTKKEVDSLKVLINKQNNSNSVQTQILINQMKLEGLKSEKRMIQSTDRRILDVNRQSEIDKEINELSK